MQSTLQNNVQLQGIDQRLRYFSFAVFAVVLLIQSVAVLIVSLVKGNFIWLFLLLTPVLLWLSWRYCTQYYQRFGYALLDDGIWIESGVYWRSATFVPRPRVQHTEVNHGPVDRKMDLAKLVIHTAGIRLQHITIPGLTNERAHELRDALLKREQALAGPHTAPPKAPPMPAGEANASQTS